MNTQKKEKKAEAKTTLPVCSKCGDVASPCSEVDPSFTTTARERVFSSSEGSTLYVCWRCATYVAAVGAEKEGNSFNDK